MTEPGASNRVKKTPASWWARLTAIGPAVVVAAGGVGAGDLISALTSSARFGMTLLWAAVVGVVLKYVATEGLGRLYMASGETILRSIRRVGLWLSVIFMVFLVIMGLLYGAALSSLVALAANAMFPVMPEDAWAILFAIVAFLILLVGRYLVFEKFMFGFAILMFIGMVGTAAKTLTGLKNPAEFTAHLVPSLPQGSTVFVLAVLGGVGGTFGVASYGYWVRDKGWRGPAWIPTMRVDATAAYVITFIFAFALFVIGSNFLFTTGTTISGEEGLLTLAAPLGNSLGTAFRWLFLIGFFFVAFSSLVGGFNALSYLIADNVRILRKVPEEQAEEYTSQNSLYFRAALVYVTFPSMAFTLTGEPVVIAVAYAAFGALILPILAIVLLWHLNSKTLDRRYRNKILSNVLLVLVLVVFSLLGVREIIGLF